MARVLVIGSTNVDLAVRVERHPSPGETLSARTLHTSPGGKGANQALAAALSGADVVFAAKAGRDAYADEALRLLRTSGVDLSRVEVVDDPTGMAFITRDDSGENSIVIIPGANGAWRPEDVRTLASAIADAEAVVCQGEIPAEVVDAVAVACRAASTRFVLNLAPVIDVARETLTAGDPLVVNQHEARLAADALGIAPADDDSEMIRAVVAAGVPSLVLSRGADSTLLVSADRVDEIVSCPVDVVDTTGAGDAFVGAFVAKLADGADTRDAARYAAAFAADTVTRAGAQESYRRG